MNRNHSNLLSSFPFTSAQGENWEASALDILTAASAEPNIRGVAMLIAQPHGFQIQQLLIAHSKGDTDYAMWTNTSNRSTIQQVDVSFHLQQALDYLQRSGVACRLSLDLPPDPERGRVVWIWVAVDRRGAWRQLQAPVEGHSPENPLDRLINEFQNLTQIGSPI